MRYEIYTCKLLFTWVTTNSVGDGALDVPF